MANIKELNIEKKPTKYQKKKEKRKIVRDVKEKIKKDWESDVVERFVNTYMTSLGRLCLQYPSLQTGN